MCKSDRNSIQQITTENLSLLRNVDNYTLDITKPCSEMGINRDCILNELGYYHVTNNNFVDFMHDVAEGVAAFGMVEIIKHYIDCKVFTVYSRSP